MQEQKYTWGFISEEAHGKDVKMTFMTQYFEGMGRLATRLRKTHYHRKPQKNYKR